MRFIFSTLLFCLCTLLSAQPSNDDCTSAMDLGTAPICDGTIFTNADATPSNIGDNNQPDCFSDGNLVNDVWFSFTTTDELPDLTLTIESATNGPADAPLINPQVAIYRGNCETNGLDQLFCEAVVNEQTAIRLDLLGLTADVTYYIRISDGVSSEGLLFPGDFTVCIQDNEPILNLGMMTSTTACSGRLFDSGGPAGNYKNNENQTFTICPSEPHSCIELDIAEFTIDEFDVLNIYAGDGTNAPLIARASGASLGSAFQVEAASECVTVQFISDASNTFAGFEMAWSCKAETCDGSSFANPTPIGSIPFSQSGLSTCGAASTFATSPCTNAPFLSGPERIFAYDAPGGFCASISVTNAAPGTGILVLDGDPASGSSSCVAFSMDGTLNSADMRAPGTYYIVVANALGCTDFSLSIEETDCSPSPALQDALCNPINNCITDVTEDFTLLIENGFQDIEINTGVNGGCWLNDGVEPDYFWFTVEAAASGDLAFSMESAGLESDIDFNIWGPFSVDQACGNPSEVITFIENNQPIRSSWNTSGGPTGLARVHPVTGNTISDNYDCGGTPSGQGDGFVLPVEMQAGEIYVVLLNDFDNEVGAAGISIDWSASDPGVLTPVPTAVLSGNTAICEGESTVIELQNFSNAIRWIGNTNTLSCVDCPNPTATPQETTIYTAIVEKACGSDTVEVEVAIYEVDAGPDREVCAAEEFQIIAGRNYADATYAWSVASAQFQDLVEFSCTDCPDPVISTNEPNALVTFAIQVTLTTDNCTLTDDMQLTLRTESAPQFSVIDDLEVCTGENIALGGSGNPGTNTYTWTSVPAGFQSSAGNPTVAPTETTTYFVNVTNQSCGLPSSDSVTVTVVAEPVVSVISDATICQGDAIILGNTALEAGVTYQWTGPEEIFSPENPNTAVQPNATASYSLRASSGPCVVTENVSITVTPSLADINQGDTTRVCQGDETELTVSVQPPNTQAIWTSSDGSVNDVTGNELTVSPQGATTYYATVTNENCTVIDSILVVVDSLPADLSIMPSDTTICEGSLLIFESPIFEPKEYPEIAFQWFPAERSNFQTPDSLYNMVSNPDTTIMIFRETVNGACIDTAVTNVMVDTIPDISIMPMDTTTCIGERVDITVRVNAELEMPMWEPADGLSCMDCLTPSTIVTSDKDYTFMAMAGECSVQISTSIRTTPLFAFPDQTTICLGDPPLLLNSFEFQGAQYTWTSSDPDFGTVTEPSPMVSPTETTTYFLRVESPICDPVEAELTITVLEEPQIQLATMTTICSGDQVTLNSIESPGATYTWSPSLAGATPSVSPTQSTTYTLNVSNGVCPQIDTQLTVIVLPDPVLPPLTDVTICQNESISLGGAPEPGLTYTWESTDPDFSTNNNSSITVSPESTATYTVTVASSCKSEQASVTVNVTPSSATLTLSADPGTSIIQGDEVTVSAQSSISTPDDRYDWIISGGGSRGINSSFTDSPSDTVTYIVTYTAGGNCFTITDSITILVRPLPDFKTPNAFTPNGDTENDFFIIETIGDVQILDFKIYNRWGQVVYDNDNNDMGWDGNFKGNPAPSDVYIYVIELDGVPDEDRIQKGDVTLVR